MTNDDKTEISRLKKDQGIPLTQSSIVTLIQCAWAEYVPLLYIYGLPGGGWGMPDPEDPGIPDRPILMRMLRRLKETYLPDEDWEDIMKAPPRDGVDTR